MQSHIDTRFPGMSFYIIDKPKAHRISTEPQKTFFTLRNSIYKHSTNFVSRLETEPDETHSPPLQRGRHSQQADTRHTVQNLS